MAHGGIKHEWEREYLQSIKHIGTVDIPKVIVEWQQFVQKLPPVYKGSGEQFEKSAPAFIRALEIAQPKHVLELGFNRGASSSLMLFAMPNVTVHSTDIARIQLRLATVIFDERFPGRFSVEHIDHADILNKHQKEWTNKFDLIFVDGHHEYKTCLRDLETAHALAPQYILVDDIFHCFPALSLQIQKAIAHLITSGKVQIIGAWGEDIADDRQGGVALLKRL